MPGATEGRPTPDGAGGRPPHPPPRTPPSQGATGAALRPPRAEGTPPPPEGTATRGGGGGSAAGTAPAGVTAAGRAHTSVLEQRPQWNSMGAAPHMTLP